MKFASPSVIKVSGTDVEASVEALRQSLIHREVLSNRQDMLELLDHLAYLPLAMCRLSHMLI